MSGSEPSKPKIGKREMDALAECVSFLGRGGKHFIWKRASMEKLVQADFVAYGPVMWGCRSYVPTEEGLAALKEWMRLNYHE